MYDAIVAFSINKEETVFEPRNRTHSKVTLDDLPRTIAGSSLNVVRALREFGHKVKLLCTVGRDSHAPDISESLSEWSIDPYLIPVRHGTPRTIVLLPEANPRETVLFCHKPPYDQGLLARAAQDVADQVAACQPKCRVATGVRPEDVVLVRELFRADGYRVLNPNIELIKLRREFSNLACMADLIVMNHEEASSVLGKDPVSFDHERDMPRLGKVLTGKEIIVTMNSHGSCYWHNPADSELCSHYVPSCAEAVVDPTGAGDVYLAGYLSARLGGCQVHQAMRFATAAAAAKVGKIGGSAIPTRAETELHFNRMPHHA